MDELRKYINLILEEQELNEVSPSLLATALAGGLAIGTPEIGEYPEAPGVEKVEKQAREKQQPKKKLSFKELEPIIRRASKKYNVPVELIDAIIETESNYRPFAKSGANARGLMQITKVTGTWLGLENFYNPEENIMAGTKYLAYLLKRFDNNLILTIASFNAGPTIVSRLGKIPDYSETQNYVRKVLKKMGKKID